MATAEPKVGYSPPIMTADDIVEGVNSCFDLQIKKADLIPGDPDKIMEIYWAILSDFYPNLDTICQPKLLPNVEVTEDMDGFIATAHLFHVLKDLLGRLKFYDVRHTDLLMPTFKRTQAIFSHLFNFWRFRNSPARREAVAKVTERCLELQAKKDELLAAAPNIERELTNIDTKMYEVKDATNQVSQNLYLCRMQLKSKLEEKEVLQQYSAKLKEEYSKCQQENKDLSSSLQELKKRNENLVEKIVDSPSQIEKKIKAKRLALDALKSEIKMNKKRFNEVIEHTKNYAANKDKVNTLVANTKTIKEFIENQETRKGAISGAESKMLAIRDNIAETEAAIENCESELKLLTEKKAKLENQHHAKKSSLRTQLKEAELSKEKLSDNANQINIALESALEEYEILTNRMKQAKARAEEAEKRALTYKDTLAALDHYHGILFTYLKNVQAIIEKIASRPNMGSIVLKMTEDYCRGSN